MPLYTFNSNKWWKLKVYNSYTKYQNSINLATFRLINEFHFVMIYLKANKVRKNSKIYSFHLRVYRPMCIIPYMSDILYMLCIIIHIQNLFTKNSFTSENLHFMCKQIYTNRKTLNSFNIVMEPYIIIIHYTFYD